jgi:hypothetical protein
MKALMPGHVPSAILVTLERLGTEVYAKHHNVYFHQNTHDSENYQGD